MATAHKVYVTNVEYTLYHWCRQYWSQACTASHEHYEVYTAVNSCCDGELVLLLACVGARLAHACLPMHAHLDL